MSNLTSGFIDTILGRYKIESRLGMGGMARVFKAQDLNLKRSVAIKVLHEHLTDQPTFKERFIQEAQLVAALNHPNIIQVYDFDAIDQDNHHIYYMVMPYIDGGALSDLLDHSHNDHTVLPTERVIHIMRDLCGALSYAHGKGMIHRDVKPANILFDEHNKAILTDFGIARLAENSQLTKEGITIGTPLYMSPEQATGSPVDARSDIYSLGIIFYQMLTGRTPFEDDGTLSILLKHVNEPVPRISEFVHFADSSLDTVVFRALAKDPAERYQSTEQFVKDIEAALAGNDISPTVEPAPIVIPAGPSTVEFETPPQIHQPGETTTIQRLNSPLGILAFGMTIIVVLLGIALISRQPAINTLTDDNISDSMTGDVYFTSTFSSDDPFLSYWPQGTTGAINREIRSDAQYHVSNERPGTASTTLFEEGKIYGDVSLTMVASLQEGSSPASGYGIIFRYQDNDNYNVFAVDGLGRYSIWRREGGDWLELRALNETWTSNAAIAPIAETNTLTISIHDNNLYGYINGQQVVQLTEDRFTAGGIGIYLATTDNGAASIAVDMYEASESTPLADSMTGESDNLSDSMTGDDDIPESTEAP